MNVEQVAIHGMMIDRRKPKCREKKTCLSATLSVLGEKTCLSATLSATMDS